MMCFVQPEEGKEKKTFYQSHRTLRYTFEKNLMSELPDVCTTKGEGFWCIIKCHHFPENWVFRGGGI